MRRFISANEECSTSVGKTSIKTSLDEVRITLSSCNEYFALFKVSGKLYGRI
jgi:hypothetical protein